MILSSLVSNLTIIVSNKEVFIISGPNGAGKTTFAVNLIDEGWVDHFVNADEIAKEYVDLPTNRANLLASRIFLKTLEQLAVGNESFAFETTLSGKPHVNRIKRLQADGWRVSLFYLFVSSPEISRERVAERVAHGGHNIPTEDIIRRYPKSISQFFNSYLPIVDYAECIYNEGDEPQIILKSKGGILIYKHPAYFDEFLNLEQSCRK